MCPSCKASFSEFYSFLLQNYIDPHTANHKFTRLFWVEKSDTIFWFVNYASVKKMYITFRLLLQLFADKGRDSNHCLLQTDFVWALRLAVNRRIIRKKNRLPFLLGRPNLESQFVRARVGTSVHALYQENGLVRVSDIPYCQSLISFSSK